MAISLLSKWGPGRAHREFRGLRLKNLHNTLKKQQHLCQGTFGCPIVVKKQPPSFLTGVNRFGPTSRHKRRMLRTGQNRTTSGARVGIGCASTIDVAASHSHTHRRVKLNPPRSRAVVDWPWLRPIADEEKISRIQNVSSNRPTVGALHPPCSSAGGEACGIERTSRLAEQADEARATAPCTR